MYIGAHIPLNIHKNRLPNGNDVLKGIKQIQKWGGNAMQLFLRIPYKTSKKCQYDISDQQAKQIKEYCKNTNFLLVIHSPYILDFCKTPPPSMRNMWAANLLIDDLKITKKLGGIGCVIHMGRQQEEQTLKDAYANMVASIDYVLSKAPMGPKVILETSSAEGTKIGGKLECFAKLYNSFSDKSKKRLGLCVDTCHIFVAGHPIHTPKGMNEYFTKFNKLIGLKNLTLFHLNDSKTPFESHSDRHAGLLEGHIFFEDLGGNRGSLDEIVKVAVKNKVPIILETHGDFKKEIKLVTKLAQADLKNKSKSKVKVKEKVKGGGAIKKQKGNIDQIITLFKRLADYHRSIGNIYEMHSYTRVVKQLEKLNKNITSSKNVEDLKGVGKSISAKIDEILQTGKLQILNDLENDPKIKGQLELQQVLGIGPKVAAKLVSKGITNVSDLKRGVKSKKVELNDMQKIGLKYYDDFLKRIPRSEVSKYIKTISKVLYKYDRNLIIEPAGSYRMGKPTSGDIDLIISNPALKTRKQVEKSNLLPTVVKLLHKEKIVIEDVNMNQFKYMGVGNLYGTARHIDIRLAPYNSLATTLLYFGSGEEFSRKIRQEAKDKGYKLNEWGVTNIKTGKTVPTNKEKQIFDLLKIDYVDPKNR